MLAGPIVTVRAATQRFLGMYGVFRAISITDMSIIWHDLTLNLEWAVFSGQDDYFPAPPRYKGKAFLVCGFSPIVGNDRPLL